MAHQTPHFVALRRVRTSRAAGLAALAAVLVLAACAWLAVKALDARRHLLAARTAAQAVEQAALAGDLPAARRALAVVQREASQAHHETSGPLWWAAAHVPYAGRTPRTIRDLTAILDDVAADALPPLIRAGEVIDPARVHVVGVEVPLRPLLDSQPPLQQAATVLTDAQNRLGRVPDTGVLGPVARARAEVVAQVGRLDDEVSRAATATALASRMLGAQGTRHYLLALQNNAESRGTGGLMGAWGILTAKDGRVSLSRMGSVEDLPTTAPDMSGLGAGYARLYGTDPGLWTNANESPTFPYAAQLWLSMWRRYTGHPLDGVIATDPVALGYLIGVVGPVRLSDGTTVTAANAVATVEQHAYARYAVNRARKTWLLQIARAVFDAVGHRRLDRHALLDALSRGVQEHRVLAYSVHPDEQRQLASTPLGGVLPNPDASFVSLVVNNAGGNKLDYYLHRAVDYDFGTCHDGIRDSTLTVRLFNDVPRGSLPAYVTVRADTGNRSPVGSNRLLVYLFLTRGAAARTVTVDGKPTPVVTGSEGGHPVIELPLDLARDQTRVLVVHLQEPAYGEQPVLREQPLVVPQVSRVHWRGCGSG